MKKNNPSAHFDLQRLKAIPISRVVSRLGQPLRRSGCRQLTLCPWHDDHHPSLTLYEAAGENRCHCFACGRGGDTVGYVMQQQGIPFQEALRLLADIGGILPEAQGQAATHRTAQKPQERAGKEPPTAYVPDYYLRSHLSDRSSFCQCLRHYFPASLVSSLARQYRLGQLATQQYPDDTLFPTIDTQGRVRNLKVQHYDTDPASPSFFLSDKSHVFWLGSSLQRSGIADPRGRLDGDCLFGAHLLPLRPRDMVMLTESPKNALLGAALCPQHVWVATGSKGQLKPRVLQPLAGRRVTVYPDRDAIDEWRRTLAGMDALALFSVSDFCERFAPPGEPHFDLADYIVRTLPPVTF